MTNKISKTFTVNGVVYELKFTMMALSTMEDLTGKCSGEIFSNIQSDDRFSVTDLCSLFYAGLSHMDDIDRSTALEILDQVGITKGGELIAAALKVHFGTDEPKKSGGDAEKK